MKKIFFILLIIPILSYGQEKEIIELRNEINTVKENLDLHHKQFIGGAITLIVGNVATIIGGLTITPILIIGGGIASLVGTGIMIDSDKWFGKKYMNEDFKSRNKNTLTEEPKDVDDVLRDYYLDFSKIDDKEYKNINTNNIKTSIFRYDFIKIVTNENIYFGVFSTHGKEQLELYYLTNNNSTYRLINYHDIIEIKKLK